jgi:hypothetical protein
MTETLTLRRSLRYYGFAMLAFTSTLASASGSLARCVDKVCLGDASLTFPALQRDHGGVPVKQESGFNTERSVCFSDSGTKASAVLSFSGDADLKLARLDSIFVTTVAVCQGRSRQGPLSSTWAADNGVQLGWTKDQVRSALGDPARIDDAVRREARNPRYKRSRQASRYGVERWHYEMSSKELIFNQIGFDRSGAVVSIWLNATAIQH